MMNILHTFKSLTTRWVVLLVLTMDLAASVIIDYKIVSRGQCLARCLELYEYPESDEAGINTGMSPAKVKCTTNNCSQCIPPCSWGRISREKCSSVCKSEECHLSCMFIEGLLNDEESVEGLPTSGTTLNVGPITFGCLAVSRASVVSSRYSIRPPVDNKTSNYIYIKWQTRSSTTDVDAKWAAFILLTRWRDTQGISKWNELVVLDGWEKITVQENKRYQFRVYPVLPRGLAGPSRISKWIQPQIVNITLQKPENMSVKQVVVDNKVFLHLSWKPPEVPLCHYTLYVLPKAVDEAPDEIRFLQMSELRKEIGPFHFGNGYTLKLASCTREYDCSRDTASVHITTVACLWATGENFDLCPPPPPTGFSVNNIASVNCSNIFVAQWNPPENVTATNTIAGYELSWDKMIGIDKHPHYDTVQLLSNVTRHVLDEFQPDNWYTFSLTAISKGGRSQAVFIKTNTSSEICQSDTIEAIGSGLPTIHAAKQTVPWAFAILACVLILLFVFITIVTVRLCNGHRSQRNPQQPKIERMTANPIYHSLQPIPSAEIIRNAMSEGETSLPADEYEISREDVSVYETLGEGAFGVVKKAVLRKAPSWMVSPKLPYIVAVKKPKDGHSEDRNGLLGEIKLMKTLGRHPNVVCLVASCTGVPEPLLVMDYCPYGDLRRYLMKLRLKHAPSLNLCSLKETAGTGSGSGIHYDDTQTSDDGSGHLIRNSTDSVRSSYITPENPAQPMAEEISEHRLLSYAEQIVRGMDYLARKKFVHRDLAARNVLVYDKNQVKISDFGLTRDVYEDSFYKRSGAGELPLKWMSIEAIFDQIYTTQSDVWSFGIVLWEIVTLGGSPYPGIPCQDLFRLLKEGYRMEKPDNCSEQIYRLMLACWHPTAGERPTFKELKLDIGNMMKDSHDTKNAYISFNLEKNEDYYLRSSSFSRTDAFPRKLSVDSRGQGDTTATSSNLPQPNISTPSLLTSM